MTIIMGDINEKVRTDNTDREKAMDMYGCGTINNNGERLVNFCLNSSYVIGGTIFPHRDIHKLTWTSPDGRTVNQIDHFIINRKWRRSHKTCDHTDYREADANSDHFLVVCRVRLKLRATKENQSRPVLDMSKLKKQETQREFALELKNRFNILENTQEDTEDDIEKEWKNIKEAYCETSRKVLRFRRRKDKGWITTETWQKIEERKKNKRKTTQCKVTSLERTSSKNL